MSHISAFSGDVEGTTLDLSGQVVPYDFDPDKMLPTGFCGYHITCLILCDLKVAFPHEGIDVVHDFDHIVIDSIMPFLSRFPSLHTLTVRAPYVSCQELNPDMKLESLKVLTMQSTPAESAEKLNLLTLKHLIDHFPALETVNLGNHICNVDTFNNACDDSNHWFNKLMSTRGEITLNISKNVINYELYSSFKTKTGLNSNETVDDKARIITAFKEQAKKLNIVINIAQ